MTLSKAPTKKTSQSPILVLFLTVFIDLVGFGIILPLSPYLARQYSATPLEVGLLMTVYSAMQFLFSPIWGSLSDRYGRRPIILLSLFGGSMSYLLFALSNSLWLLFVARGLAGLFGGNISAAHAYIADVTPPEERSKGMGLIGAAFGLGFIFGPVLGGLLGEVGKSLGSQPPFGLSFAALGASILCFLNFLLATQVLKESLPPERRKSQMGDGSWVKKMRERFSEIGRQIQKPVSGSLVWVFFFSGLAMASMESMLFPFLQDRFGWGLRLASYGFAYIGVLMVLVQGVLIRKWMPKFGEPKILVCGLAFFTVALAAIGASPSIWMLAFAMTVLAFGNGMMRPPNLGMISLLSPAQEQGSTMGVTNSLASLARILGPPVGGFLYQQFGQGAPFYTSALMALIALLMVVRLYPRLPSSGKKA